jgi:hypothetical protein
MSIVFLIVYIFPYNSIGSVIMNISYISSQDGYPAILKTNTVIRIIIKELFIGIYIRDIYE